MIKNTILNNSNFNKFTEILKSKLSNNKWFLDFSENMKIYKSITLLFKF